MRPGSGVVELRDEIKILFKTLDAAATTANSAETRRTALLAFCHMASVGGAAIPRSALSDPNESGRHAAILAASLLRLADVRPQLILILREPNPQLQRAAAEALGRIGGANAVVALLDALGERHDRVLEHSLIFALIEIGDSEFRNYKLSAANDWTRRGALIARDQMGESDLKPEEVLPFLKSSAVDMRKTAAWIAGNHPEWGGALAGFFRERLAASEHSDSDRAELEQQLAQFLSNEAIQQLVGEVAAGANTLAATRQLLFRLMAGAGLSSPPNGWAEAVRFGTFASR
jgi:HEAT repeat protein